MSRAQFRANSGAAVGSIDGVEMEEIEFAGFTGRIQAKMPGAMSKSCVWPPAGAGAAGADCGPENGRDWQHDILPPHWQHARAFTQDAGVGAANSGVPASRKLQMMANASFMC